MALFRCPECGNSISDKAERCPYCGLPAAHFGNLRPTLPAIDFTNLGNVLISFDRDYCNLFDADRYVTHRDQEYLRRTYGEYYKILKNKMVFQYVSNNSGKLRLDMDSLKRFLLKMHTLDTAITSHNANYVDEALVREKDYFDNILKDIDPAIQLDEEQRRAVITDDDYCLLVAGAGAGKTTTMAAKVK